MKTSTLLLVVLWQLLPASSFVVTITTRKRLPLAASAADDENALMEGAWRHVKKPLLSIGGKGASPSHGNSLRQLLQDHTAVKVKVNTKAYNNSMESAFESLAQLVVQAGSPEPPELLQYRPGDRVLLLGLPGTRERILQGTFPPVPASNDE